MLKATWSRPACRKPLVTSRQYSPPGSMAGPKRPSLANSCDPPFEPIPNCPEPRNSTTLTAMSATVTVVTTVFIERTVWTFVRSLEHSGQRMPTGVEVMHSVQIGRPQFEHETAVSRLGCR